MIRTVNSNLLETLERRGNKLLPRLLHKCAKLERRTLKGKGELIGRTFSISGSTRGRGPYF
jgi:hypothetical protein